MRLMKAGEADHADQLLTSDPNLRDLLRRLRAKNAGDGLLPALAFVALDLIHGLEWGMAGATTVSIAIALYRHRRGERTNPLVWFVVGIALARGGAGILTRSTAVYFGPGIVTGYLTSVVMVVSVLVGRPVLGLMTNAVWPLPAVVRFDPHIQRSFARLTTMWAVYAALATTAQLWLLLTVSPSVFVLARLVVSWSTTLPLVAITLRRLRRIVADGRQIVAATACP